MRRSQDRLWSRQQYAAVPVHDIVMYTVYTIKFCWLEGWRGGWSGDIKVHPWKLSRSGEPHLAICDHFGHGLWGCVTQHRQSGGAFRLPLRKVYESVFVKVLVDDGWWILSHPTPRHQTNFHNQRPHPIKQPGSHPLHMWGNHSQVDGTCKQLLVHRKGSTRAFPLVPELVRCFPWTKAEKG